MTPFKIIHIVGARPNFIKIAPIMRALSAHAEISQMLVHTGQHYDYNMSEQFFSELGIPAPDIHLGVGSDSHARQVANIMMAFEKICQEEKPQAILVVGDVNSTMACTLVASKMGIKVLHVEAGIRSRDRSMPEEINRLVTDALADYLLPPSRDAVENLLQEGHPEDKIHLVGNIMIDTLHHSAAKVQASAIISELGLEAGTYATLTLHRPSNVDAKESFAAIVKALEHIQNKMTIVFPVHPRTAKMIENLGFEPAFQTMKNIRRLDPLGYFDFGRLIKDSAIVLTDSGGIQEETTVYGIPCITLRHNTERPITIWEGTNELAGDNTERIISLFEQAIAGQWRTGKIPELWDGKAGERIAGFIAQLAAVK